MTSQTIRQMKILARDMNISIHELHRRRASKSEAMAYADVDGTVQLRPRVLCSRDLTGWRLIFRKLFQ